jgi:hypothetical protein
MLAMLSMDHVHRMEPLMRFLSALGWFATAIAFLALMVLFVGIAPP